MKTTTWMRGWVLSLATTLGGTLIGCQPAEVGSIPAKQPGETVEPGTGRFGGAANPEAKASPPAKGGTADDGGK